MLTVICYNKTQIHSICKITLENTVCKQSTECIVCLANNNIIVTTNDPKARPEPEYNCKDVRLRLSLLKITET